MRKSKHDAGGILVAQEEPALEAFIVTSGFVVPSGGDTTPAPVYFPSVGLCASAGRGVHPRTIMGESTSLASAFS